MKDGRSARAHVAGGYRRDPAGFAEALALVTPGPVPPAAAAAVAAFERLSASRGSGIAGPHPISLHDCEAYSRLVTPLTPRDVALITAMDAASREALTHE